MKLPIFIILVLSTLCVMAQQPDPFSPMYGNYIVLPSSLATCKTDPNCAAACCPTTINVTQLNPNLVQITWFSDPSTYSRCGITSPEVNPKGIQVGIVSITTSQINTQTGPVLGVQFGANLMILPPQYLFLYQNQYKSCIVETGPKIGGSSVGSSSIVSIMLIVGMILSLLIV